MHELELKQVGKTFKNKTAVQDVNVLLGHGVYGLLGENGAGKTTLMRMLCGILKPTHGTIRCDGIPIMQMGGEYRRLLGYLPQDFGYYGDFSALRFLNYMAALKALPEEYAKNRIDELLEMVDLTKEKKNKLKTFSGGMLRRIGIAQALLNDPEILVLDEPTSGLDPGERVRFRNIISSLGKNRLVILSTHIVSDIEYIADQIMIMKEGTILHIGDEAKILEAAKGCVWKCIVSGSMADELGRQYVISNLRNQGEQVELRIVSMEKPVEDAESVEVTLEDAYLFFTKKKYSLAGIG
ncbi:MAG: ABC transporter ATP-binding protein [Lachnospiraceae bacterium]|nr:ABC transporter ATP-binding protein [Lachnospiraceae bacterium]